ncbi:MAG: GGDEF domain-containing protein [Myxococcales bacterium]|nr:GGDEF domain-containing protein [Myxococcales bacterium]
MNEQDDITAGMAVPKVVPPDGERTPVLMVVGGPRTSIGRVYRITSDLLLGRAGEADVWLDGEGVSRKHARVLRDGTSVTLVDLGSKNGSWVNGEKVDRRALSAGDLVQVGAHHLLRFTWQDQLDEAAHRTLMDNAIRDGLTGACNRTYFLDQLRKEVSAAMRHGDALSLALLDLDLFKVINDTHGHAAGDLVLRHFARTVNTLIRSEDTFGRIGGEDFSLILRACPEGEAVKVMDRIRQEVEQLDLMHGDTRVVVTVSIGVAALQAGVATSDVMLMEQADKAMYRAKRAGRNRVAGSAPES